MTRQQQINGISALLTFPAAVWALTFGLHSAGQRIWVQAMVGLAAFESVAGFVALSVAMRRSNKVFFSVFGGGLLMRLILLGLAAYVLQRWSSSVTLPLLALVLVYFISSLIQLPFLARAS